MHHYQLDTEDHSIFPHKNEITNHIYSLYESGKLVDTDIPNRAADIMDKGLISPIPGECGVTSVAI